MTLLRTRRLDLTPLAPTDAAELHALFNVPDVGRYLLDGTTVSRSWVEDEIAASTERFHSSGCGLWALRAREAAAAEVEGRTAEPDGVPVHRSDGPIVGFTGFRPFFEPAELQLLYGLLPACWGQGLAREAAGRVLDHAFDALGLDEVRAATDRPNLASIRVLEALGFRLVRESDEGVRGTRFYALTRRGRHAHPHPNRHPHPKCESTSST